MTDIASTHLLIKSVYGLGYSALLFSRLLRDANNIIFSQEDNFRSHRTNSCDINICLSPSSWELSQGMATVYNQLTLFVKKGS